ncbi:uncharacterized protein N7469_002060 [Penicillium citrinum]|uniref:Uncharacterized protein n=1 Tax=Penicillium citrinum TaxID=5077 RepID=A0A9W9P9K2_PENCI|nr:uncharacterized protein N7469_002060 [Penicillium citrinum]KAJ5240469.1 hypothetical protein N7469_002060 [Penicillium citrinum]
MSSSAASPSPVGRPTKRQRRVSEDVSNDSDARESITASSSTITRLKISASANLPTTQLQQILRCNADLAAPALKLLDLYLCLWETYVLKSAENIRLEDERRQMSESNERLEYEIDTLLQCCNRQSLELEGRKQAMKAFHGSVISALQIIDPPYSIATS